MEYHVPAMVQECLEGLHIRPDGIYVDATFGGGGHSRAILEKLGVNGRLIAFDQDEQAFQNSIPDPRFLLIHSNFRYLRRFLKYYGIGQIDGLLADLGVSSYQLDIPGRGFAFRHQGQDLPLDMRMNQQQPRTAADVINHTDPVKLEMILREYGEVWNARRLVELIRKRKGRSPVTTVAQLEDLARSVAVGPVHQYLAKVFQAIRIEVNEEMTSLRQLLNDAVDVLKPGGRLVVISYHSLEDRMVKHLIQSGDVDGQVKKDPYGKKITKLRAVSKKTIQPSEEEIKENYRVRSARLRIAEKSA